MRNDQERDELLCGDPVDIYNLLIASEQRVTELTTVGNHVISNILTDSQLDTRVPCGVTIREWKALLDK